LTVILESFTDKEDRREKSLDVEEEKKCLLCETSTCRLIEARNQVIIGKKDNGRQLDKCGS
jgi:hypothetical protein